MASAFHSMFFVGVFVVGYRPSCHAKHATIGGDFHQRSDIRYIWWIFEYVKVPDPHLVAIIEALLILTPRSNQMNVNWLFEENQFREISGLQPTLFPNQDQLVSFW